ncbi:MAG: hypothetical protein ABSC06_03465 [Rhodopila sp.]
MSGKWLANELAQQIALSPSRRHAPYLILALGGPLVAGPASADGILFVTSSRYVGTAETIAVGQALPISTGAIAVADGSYPDVFANDTVDGNFGITAPIALQVYDVASRGEPDKKPLSLRQTLNVTAASGVSTSFSSKSELAVNLSTDGKALTLMGYVAQPNILDVSNANTPGNVDPTNTDIQTPTYRAVVEIDLTRWRNGITATPVNAYSGNNGRAAILATDVNGSGQHEYLMAGNAGNGSGTEPVDIVNDTGVQTIVPGSTSPDTTVIGAPQGTPGTANGFEYGFAVAQLGDPADKSGKDDNLRGLTVAGNTLYVSKGSGGNGINTVYQVSPGHSGLPLASDGPTTQISILPGFPTGLASAISEKSPATEFYPFGLWFANATTLYVADEGSQDLNPDPNAGMQKWIFDGSKWTLAYTIQAGLNLDQPYGVADYPEQYNPATTGLRNLTGFVDGNSVRLFATTATFSSLGDPGADPNGVVQVVDQLDATALPAGEAFTTVVEPRALHVYRGVAYDDSGEG